MISSVIAGDYKGKLVKYDFKGVYIDAGNFFKTTKIRINKDTVSNYEVKSEEHQKSASSAISRAAVGGALLGPAGLFAGATAKTKSEYIVAIEFKDGKRSLLEVDHDKHKEIITAMF